MNPINLTLFPLPIDCNIGSEDRVLKSKKDYGEYFANPTKTHKGDFYLELLRKSLLGKGKPLNKISLTSNDLPLLKKLLLQCGFSQESTDNLLSELLKNNPFGEIKLSQFFNKAAELGPPKKEIYPPFILEPSAIPYIESALNELGLTPKEVEYLLSSARVDGGQLDLNKFIINLKEKGEKQILIQSAKKSQVPTDVKAVIDQIVETIGSANKKDETQFPLLSFSKPGLTDLHSKEKLSNEGKRVEMEGLRTPSKEKGGISSKNEQQKGESSFFPKEAQLSSHMDAGKTHRPRPGMTSAELNNGKLGFNRKTLEEGSVVKSKTRVMDIGNNIPGSGFLESINTVKENGENVKNFFPSYLIDQVGKQISRSILRGDKIIRLQLKPPELGTLRVEMDMKDNILKLGMITENGSVKELLLSNVNELRDALMQQGVKLERLDVQINHNFDQSLAHSKEGQKEGQNQDHNWMPLIESGTEDPLSRTLSMTATVRLLDLVA